MRCVCVVASVAALMLFLRVEEEEYAKQTGTLGSFHRQTGHLPALMTHSLRPKFGAARLNGT